MDDWFSTIRGGCQPSASTVETLLNKGFATIPGPVTTERMACFAEAYDAAMNSGNDADLKVGSTTRLLDFVNRGYDLNEVYVYLPFSKRALTSSMHRSNSAQHLLEFLIRIQPRKTSTST